ncbi:GNAT family N-acetyltransferase [Thalassotalea euphylliae]|uniref:GNAT family N-acetyltransferase n=1 Tax=Thalassotalea euphylliae TaxID=1655234 RepID=UPI00362BCBA6
MSLTHQFHQSIETISPSQWNTCFGTQHPFTRYEFLAALEVSGCVSGDTGWQPFHLVISNAEDEVVAAMPCYVKGHSYGEYLFDWSWAQAYEQHGIEYYPKLLGAVPFTPVGANRIGFATDSKAIQAEILTYVTSLFARYAEANHLQTIQLLFLTKAQQNQMRDHGWITRRDVQYHWFNRNYASFQDFTATLTARKRKSLLKERKKVEQNEITIKRIAGEQASAEDWHQFHQFYVSTYQKRSGHFGYLNKSFFREIGKSMHSQTTLVFAYHNDVLIAGALFFHDNEHLYGRYWGCLAEFDFLHFELCYYQGIELCIEKGLSSFNAGAQGQHKIKRGFEPVYVYGSYQVFHPSFVGAIERFIEQEYLLTEEHFMAAQSALPYKVIDDGQ